MPSGDKQLKSFVELLKTREFLEKLVLLLITAVLTGFLVPEFAARFAAARFREQKVFDAELQRQRDVLSAQSELLNQLAKLLWEFQLLNIDVSFYKVNGDVTAYHKAVEKYQNEAAGRLAQIRVQISASRRLTSPDMQRRLSKLYFETLLRVDQNLEQLVSMGPQALHQAWVKQHEASFGAAQKEIDDVLTALAVEFKLSAPAAAAN